MAITYGVTTNSATAGTGATTKTTAGVTTQNGDTFVICVMDDDPPTSVFDNKGNTYSLVVSASGIKQMYVAQGATTGGAGHTFSATYSSTAWCAVFGLWIRGAASYDTGSVNNGGGVSQPWPTGSITFANAAVPNLLLAFVAPTAGSTSSVWSATTSGTGPAPSAIAQMTDFNNYNGGVLTAAQGTFATGYSQSHSLTSSTTVAPVMTVAFAEASGGGTSLTPGQGAISLAGQVPTVARTANQSLTPNQGALTFSGPAPTLAQTANKAVTPSVGAMSFTGYAPTIAQSSGATITPGVGAITFTGYAPTISQPQALTVGTGAISLTGFAPTVSQPQAVNPGTGAIGFTGYAASIAQTANQSIAPNVGALAFTGYGPSVAQSANQAVVPDPGALTLMGLVPTVTVASASVSLVPDVGVLTLTGWAPEIAQSRSGGIDPFGAKAVLVRKKKPLSEKVAGPPLPPSLRDTIEKAFSPEQEGSGTTTDFDEDEEEALMLLL